jgi:hypothetical protein
VCHEQIRQQFEPFFFSTACNGHNAFIIGDLTRCLE